MISMSVFLVCATTEYNTYGSEAVGDFVADNIDTAVSGNGDHRLQVSEINTYLFSDDCLLLVSRQPTSLVFSLSLSLSCSKG